MQHIITKLEYGLNDLSLADGTYHAPTNGQPYSLQGHWGDIAAPYQATGWPPEVQEYIKRVAVATAMAIVDSIYTEEELSERVDGILLDNEPPKMA